MALPRTLANEAVGWTIFAASLLAPSVVAMLLWTPFLLSGRVRLLFERLPPTGSPAPTYGLVGVAASLPYVLGLLGALTVDATGRAIFTVTALVSVGYVVGIPIVAVLGLPRAGIDWDPTGYGPSTWALLLAGVAWYVLIYAVPLTLLSILFSLP